MSVLTKTGNFSWTNVHVFRFPTGTEDGVTHRLTFTLPYWLLLPTWLLFALCALINLVVWPIIGVIEAVRFFG